MKKKNTNIYMCMILSAVLTGCGTTDFADVIPQEPAVIPAPPAEERPAQEFTEPETEEDAAPELQVIPADISGTPEEIPETEEEQEPAPEEEPQADETEQEYLRSIDNMETKESVTKEEFTDDKARILDIIGELSDIMEKRDVARWKEFIAPESIRYYSNPVNLNKAQKKLPNKRARLASIDDYFRYVFIPSRKRSQVDEIRYISKTNIKAVQVKDDKSVVIYYYFTKKDGRWFVRLPEID